MYYSQDLEFNKTTLYQCFITGMLNHLTDLMLDGVHITGVDYNKDFKQEKTYCRYSICVAHSFYENEQFGGIGNANLTDKKCIDLGYNAYVLGHDHVPYATIETNNYKVIRPGSLTRGTSKTCNLYRKVQVAIFDTANFEWSEIEIPTKPGLEVFNEKNVMQKEYKMDMQEILDNLEMAYSGDVYETIDSNEESAKTSLGEIYPEVINLITDYFESHGLYRIKGAVNEN